MKKLVLAVSSPQSDAVAHHILTRFPATVGRGYGCDVILPDPYVAPVHLRVDFDGESITLANLCTVNPARKGGAPVGLSTAQAGEDVILGTTTVRIFTAGYPVPPVRPLQRQSRFLSFAARGWAATLCSAAALAAVMFWTWLGTWNRDVAAQIAAAGAGVSFLILIWGALWALAGKLVRNAPAFNAHVSFLSLYLLFSLLSLTLGHYISFFARGALWGDIASYGLDSLLLLVLLYASLGAATHIPRKKRALTATLFAAGLVAGVFGVDRISQNQFSPYAPYPPALVEHLTRFAPVTPLDGFFTESADVFAAPTDGLKTP